MIKHLIAIRIFQVVDIPYTYFVGLVPVKCKAKSFLKNYFFITEENPMQEGLDNL